VVPYSSALFFSTLLKMLAIIIHHVSARSPLVIRSASSYSMCLPLPVTSPAGG